MKNDDLKKIRQKYIELKEERSRLIELCEEIEYYEKNPIVKKYLDLLVFYRKCNVGYMYNIDKKSDDELLCDSVNSIKLDSTNNIYVYMGTFNNKENDYKVYRNLEIYSDEVNIPISKCKKFEEEKIVIYPRKTKSYNQYYFELRDEFFKIAINENQEKAVEKILLKKF